MAFNFQRGLHGMLKGVQADYKAAKEDRREWERQQRLLNAQMAKEQEMSRFRTQQEKKLADWKRGRETQWEQEDYDKGVERKAAERKSMLGGLQEEAVAKGKAEAAGKIAGFEELLGSVGISKESPEGQVLMKELITGKKGKAITPDNRIKILEGATKSAEERLKNMSEQELASEYGGDEALARRSVMQEEVSKWKSFVTGDTEEAPTGPAVLGQFSQKQLDMVGDMSEEEFSQVKESLPEDVAAELENYREKQTGTIKADKKKRKTGIPAGQKRFAEPFAGKGLLGY